MRGIYRKWTFLLLVRALFVIPSIEGSAKNGDMKPFGSIRGGDDTLSVTTTIHSMVTIFQLGDTSVAPSWLVGEDSTPYSVLLMGSKFSTPIFRITKLPSNTISMRSVGILSDTIILWLPEENNLQLLDKISETLTEIANERRARRLPAKPRLVVISSSANDSWWVEEVVQHRLQSVNPLQWDSFDILTPQEFYTQWKAAGNIMGDSSTVKKLLPYDDNAQAIGQLVKQIYNWKGGTLEETQDRWFELQAVSDLEISDSLVIEQTLESTKDPKDPYESQVVSQLERNESLVVEQMPESTEDQSQDHLELQAAPHLEWNESLVVEQIPEKKEDPQDYIQRVLNEAQQQLTSLESKVQEVQLESQSFNQMPLLDFGGQANSILESAYKELESLSASLRTGLLSRVVLEVHQLYKDQLQSLRDYYGRRYEQSLEQEGDETVWTAEAEHLTQGFQAAAQHAVPSLCQPGGALSTIVNFDSMSVFQGLVQDMLEATQLRKDEQSLAFDEDDLENLSPNKRRVPKWLKKIASRALALGINYLQGWLAWQGVKRAALERDREMPKFPLF